MRPVRDPAYLEGKELEFKLIKLDRKRNNVVVSRRAVVESEYSAEREQLLEKLQEGAVLKGVVKNLTDYGAFVDLGGIDGLLHITDMAWKRVRHPSEVVKVGEELDVRVLKYDRERNRVCLGLKQLGEDPWDNIARRYPADTRVFGKVTNVTDYGAFVEIEPGVEGLVHVSEMDWTNKNVNPSKVVQVGDEVQVMVLDVDEERRRISLGMKQCQATRGRPSRHLQEGRQGLGPDQVDHRLRHLHRPGRRHRRPGPPVGHQLELPGEDVVRNFKKGDSSRPSCWRSIRSASASRSASSSSSRIRFGLHRRPSEGLDRQGHRQGSRRQGRDHRPGRRRGRLPARLRPLARPRRGRAHVLKVGDEVEAKFIGMDRKGRTMQLSIKAKDDEEAEAVAEYSTGETSSGTSLGALLEQHNGGGDN